VVYMTQGKTAYDNGDYDKARILFENAKSNDKEGEKREQINYSLAATYIQLGQKALEAKLWKDAQNWFDKALNFAPDSLIANARNGRAQALEQLGLKDEAQSDRAFVNGKSSRAPDTLPATVPVAVYAASVVNGEVVVDVTKKDGTK